MMKRKRKDPQSPAPGGIVYSTDPGFRPGRGFTPAATPPPAEQQLRVSLDRRQRAGKTVTLVEGFVGRDEDLEALGRELKTVCGSGGTARDGLILVQGDYLQRIRDLLRKKGFPVSP